MYYYGHHDTPRLRQPKNTAKIKKRASRQARMTLSRCLLQTVQALVQFDNHSRQQTTTLRSTHENILIKIRLQKSRLNIKIAQVKVLFIRQRQQANTRNSNNGGFKHFFETNRSPHIPPRYKSLDLNFVDQLYLSALQLTTHFA